MHTHLGLLCVLGEVTFLSLWNVCSFFLFICIFSEACMDIFLFLNIIVLRFLFYHQFNKICRNEERLKQCLFHQLVSNPFLLNYILEKRSIFVPWGLNHSRLFMKQLKSWSHEDFCPICLLNYSSISYFYEFVYMLDTSVFLFKYTTNISIHIVACHFNDFIRYFD